MANETRIEFISEGFRQILFSDGCQEVVKEVAEEIADRANANGGVDTFEATTVKAPTRWIGFASTTDKTSLAAESEEKALTRALTL